MSKMRIVNITPEAADSFLRALGAAEPLFLELKENPQVSKIFHSQIDQWVHDLRVLEHLISTSANEVEEPVQYHVEPQPVTKTKLPIDVEIAPKTAKQTRVKVRGIKPIVPSIMRKNGMAQAVLATVASHPEYTTRELHTEIAKNPLNPKFSVSTLARFLQAKGLSRVSDRKRFASK